MPVRRISIFLIINKYLNKGIVTFAHSVTERYTVGVSRVTNA